MYKKERTFTNLLFTFFQPQDDLVSYPNTSKSEHSILVWTQFHPDVSMNNKLLLGSDLDHFYVIFWRGKGGRVKWDRTTVLSSSFNSSKEPFQVEIPWEHLYGSEGNRTAWTVKFVSSAESFCLNIIIDLYS